MDIYNMVTKIPYIIMLGVGLMVILQLYVGGLQDLSADVDLASEEEYRSVIILENLLNEDSLNAEIDYDGRRAMLPLDFVTVEDPDEGYAGFSTTGGHCYIDEVSGLDGENFAFGITAVEDISENAENPEPLECGMPSNEDSVWSPALLMRGDNPPMEVIVHVYPV